MTTYSPLPTRPTPPPGRQRLLGPALWAATAGRLILAGVFAFAGLAKIGDPAAYVRAVRGYDLLPDGLAVLVGRGLPAFELALALALALGVALRMTAGVAAGLLAVFTLGIATAAARGLRIDCGCFGGGGPTENPQYAGEIVRDVALLLLALAVAALGRSRLAAGPSEPVAPAPLADARQERVAQQRFNRTLARHRRARRGVAAAVAGTLLIAGATGVAIGEATEPAAPTAVPAGVTAAGGIIVGNPAAPRTLVIYEDPQCPACGQFEHTAGAVLAEAVAAGRVQVEYRMRSFLGPESVRAVAALGAAQDAGRFDALRTAMFLNQPAEHAGGYGIGDLLALGASVGLSDPAFVDAVRDQTYAPWARDVDEQAGRDGNTGTPQALLDGRVLDPDVVFDAAALRSAFA